jgi:hypothetical protein
MKIVLFNYTQNHQTDIIKKNINPDNYNIINSVDLEFDDFYGYKNVWTIRHKNLTVLKQELSRCLKNEKVNVDILFFNRDFVIVDTLTNKKLSKDLINIITEYNIFEGNLIEKKKVVVGQDHELYNNKYIISLDYIADNGGTGRISVYNLETNITSTFYHDSDSIFLINNDSNTTDDNVLFLKDLNKIGVINFTTGNITYQTLYKSDVILDEIADVRRISNSEILFRNRNAFVKINIYTKKWLELDLDGIVEIDDCNTYKYVPKIKSIIIQGVNPTVFNYELMEIKLLKEDTIWYNILFMPDMYDEPVFEINVASFGDIYVTDNEYGRNIEREWNPGWCELIVDPITWNPDTWKIKKKIDNADYYSTLAYILPDGRTLRYTYEETCNNNTCAYKGRDCYNLYLYDSDQNKIKYLSCVETKDELNIFYSLRVRKLFVINYNDQTIYIFN